MKITEKLWAEYEDFCKRDLRARHRLSVRRRHRRAAAAGPAAGSRPRSRGIGEDGRKSLLGLMAGSKEDSVETVRAFFQDLRIRGLGDPLLVVSDRASGIIRAIEECSPDRRASVASHTGCAISRPRSRRTPWPEFKAGHSLLSKPSRAIARQLATGIRADYASIAERARLLRR